MSHEAAATTGVHAATAALYTIDWPLQGDPFPWHMPYYIISNTLFHF